MTQSSPSKAIFSVTITEMITKTYEVNAASEEEAETLANALFNLDDETPAEREKVVVNAFQVKPHLKPKL